MLGLERPIHDLFLMSFRKRALRWDGETVASWEFPGVYGLMERKDLRVEFDCKNAGRSFRRSEPRLSAGLTPFHLPCPAPFQNCLVNHDMYAAHASGQGGELSVIWVGRAHLPPALFRRVELSRGLRL